MRTKTRRIPINRTTVGRLLAASLVVIIAAVGVLAYQARRSKTAEIAVPEYWPTAGWRTSTLEAYGLDSVKLAEGLAAIPQRNVGIHSLQLVHRGYLALDAYFYPYDGSIYHDFASATKSVMTTLIGIAADQGKIDLDKLVLSFFPNRTVANRDARKERITVRHLVTMSSGFKWDPVDDEAGMSQLRASSDWVQFALDLPVVSEPGTRFVYNSANSHLLSAILTKATGMTALEFAKANLFGPLGITNVHWRLDPQGLNRGWGDLSMFPRDAAKLGFLFLHKGEWQGRQIVPRKWVEKATSFQISTEGSRFEEYGYGWWVSPKEEQPAYYQAAGRGGQRIIVVPSMDMVIVVTATRESAWDDITPVIEAAIASLDVPLPANGKGVAQLEKVIQQLKQAPPARTVALPRIAGDVSGRTYVFGSNPAGIESFCLDLSSPEAAAFSLKLVGEAEARAGELGLDGNYRLSNTGVPWIARGSWVDAQTLMVEMSEGPGLNNYTEEIRFEKNKVTLEITGFTQVEGKAK